LSNQILKAFWGEVPGQCRGVGGAAAERAQQRRDLLPTGIVADPPARVSAVQAGPVGGGMVVRCHQPVGDHIARHVARAADGEGLQCVGQQRVRQVVRGAEAAVGDGEEVAGARLEDRGHVAEVGDQAGLSFETVQAEHGIESLVGELAIGFAVPDQIDLGDHGRVDGNLSGGFAQLVDGARGEPAHSSVRQLEAGGEERIDVEHGAAGGDQGQEGLAPIDCRAIAPLGTAVEIVVMTRLAGIETPEVGICRVRGVKSGIEFGRQFVGCVGAHSPTVPGGFGLHNRFTPVPRRLLRRCRL